MVNDFFLRELAPWNTGLQFHRASALRGEETFGLFSRQACPEQRRRDAKLAKAPAQLCSYPDLAPFAPLREIIFIRTLRTPRLRGE